MDESPPHTAEAPPAAGSTSERYEMAEIFAGEGPDTQHLLNVTGAVVVAVLILLALAYSLVAGLDYLRLVFG